MPFGAAQFGADRLAATGVLQDHGSPVRSQPPVAPLHQRHENREQLGALVGETVAHPGSLAWLPVWLAREQAVVHQLPQPGRGHRLPDSDALSKLLELWRAIKHLAPD